MSIMAWAIVLFAAGMVLLLAEFIVPGLVCGVLGAASLVASAVLAYRAYPEHVMLIILAELLGVTTATVCGMFLLAKTRAGRHLMLEESQRSDAGWVASESDTSLLGAEGAAFTALRPAGAIVVKGKRIDAVSEATFIEKGARIRVVEVQGSRVVVEEIR